MENGNEIRLRSVAGRAGRGGLANRRSFRLVENDAILRELDREASIASASAAREAEKPPPPMREVLRVADNRDGRGVSGDSIDRRAEGLARSSMVPRMTDMTVQPAETAARRDLSRGSR
jgi:hypothetical protein